MNTIIPPALAAIAKGRDRIKTRETAQAWSKAPQTILKLYCQTGEAYGIRPVKVGNHLLWSVAQVAAVLNGSQK